MCGKLKKALDAIYRSKLAAKVLGDLPRLSPLVVCVRLDPWKRRCSHGAQEALAGHREAHAEEVNFKVAVSGPDDNDTLRVLNRNTSWTDNGVIYENDHRHADRLAEELGLSKRQRIQRAVSCNDVLRAVVRSIVVQFLSVNQCSAMQSSALVCSAV